MLPFTVPLPGGNDVTVPGVDDVTVDKLFRGLIFIEGRRLDGLID